MRRIRYVVKFANSNLPVVGKGGYLKKSIHLGAYGWHHEHWFSTFYPDDIPTGETGEEDWLLTYYSNAFDTVIVPADYWCTDKKVDCENWLDDVHADFQFLVECHARIFDCLSMSDWVDGLKKLRPQLGALVVLKSEVPSVDEVSFSDLIESVANTLGVDVSGAGFDEIWRQDDPRPSCLAYIEDDLSDMRSARTVAEKFIDSTGEGDTATMIFDHPELQAAGLLKFRSVLEIMGY